MSRPTKHIHFAAGVPGVNASVRRQRGLDVP